tara:strand:+ start:647 stop:1060 length:414 start_codon:yes stop_codon:yes gene_type:complete
LSNKISDKDKKDWENFLSKRENLFDKDSKSLSKKINKEITFDLHGYSLDEANKEIYQLIKNSYDRGISKLVIVTGKGIHSQNQKDPYKSKDFGILKNSVPEYIRNNSDIMKMINNLSEANIEDGGSGAFYIYLKKKL